MSKISIDEAIQHLIHRHEVAKPEVEKWDKKIKTVYALRHYIGTVLWERKHKATQLRITIEAGDDAPVGCMTLDLDDDVRAYVIGELRDYLQRLITRFSSRRGEHYIVECADILSYFRRGLVGDPMTDLSQVDKQCQEDWGAIG